MDPVPARNALAAPARKLIAVTKGQTNSLLTRFNCHELQMLIDLEVIAAEGDWRWDVGVNELTVCCFKLMLAVFSENQN